LDRGLPNHKGRKHNKELSCDRNRTTIIFKGHVQLSQKYKESNSVLYFIIFLN